MPNKKRSTTPWLNNENQYGVISQYLHWSIAVALIALIIIGFIAINLPKGPWVGPFFRLHKSLGVTVLGLMIIRLGWRLFNQPPIDLTQPAWQTKLAHLVHRLLYCVVIVTAIVGWSMSSMAGHKTQWWGWVDITLPFSLNKSLAKQGAQLHNFFAWSLVVLISLHSLAALFHHYIDKNQTLKRMLPWK